MVATGQEKKLFKVREKSGNFIESRKIEIINNTTDLIPLKVGRNISGHCDLSHFLLNEEHL